LLSIFLFIEWRLSNIPTSYTLKKNLLDQSIDARIIVLGSSHSYFGINPAVWPIKGINLANTSQSLWYDKEIITRYIHNLPNLKLIILPISYFSLWYDLNTNTNEYFRQFYYFRYMHLPASSLYTNLDIRNFSLIALYTPEEVKKYVYQNFNINHSININSNGSYRDPTTRYSDINDSVGYNRVMAHESMMSENNLKINRNSIASILSVAKQNNIKVLFITIPVYHTYSDFLNKDKINFIDHEMKSVSDESTIFWRSYLTDSRFEINDFLENDHLNASGADKFSTLLFSEVIAPIIKQSN
jgi:hypothetical protein